MKTSDLFRNEFFDGLVTFGVLTLVAFINPSLWILLFSIIIAFVLSDIILNGFIHGGEGYAKIFTENKFASKGHAFIVFFVGIIVGTFLSSLVAGVILKYAQSQLEWFWAVVLTDSSAVVAVLADLEWRFYSK